MKIVKKTGIVLMALTLSMSTASMAAPYKVKTGDSFWKISKEKGISLEALLKANNADGKTIIKPGQIIEVPEKKDITNNVKINTDKKSNIKVSRSTTNRKTNVTSAKVHKVTKGDSLWTISEKYLVSIKDIIEVNEKLTEETILQIGQAINIPGNGQTKKDVKKETNGLENKTTTNNSKYGEYLEWFKDVENFLPRGADFKVIDFYTGKSYMMRRTIGSYHADVEPLTLNDTNIMKSIWGGVSWTRRPSIIEYNGKRIAGSMSFMPHAGSEKEKGGAQVSWRSGDYGPGINFDYVKGNGVDGHVDLHFKGSKRHKDGKIDPQHQEMIKIAAGIK